MQDFSPTKKLDNMEDQERTTTLTKETKYAQGVEFLLAGTIACDQTVVEH